MASMHVSTHKACRPGYKHAQAVTAQYGCPYDTPDSSRDFHNLVSHMFSKKWQNNSGHTNQDDWNNQ